MSVTIHMAGDSTMADYPPEQTPMAGWGQMLPAFFSHRASIRNEAACGRSSKSFIAEGRLEKLLSEVRPGDFVIVQFAHNDEKPGGTDPDTTYPDYLRRYAEGARARGGSPIFVTPVQRRHFDADGKLLQTHGAYPEAMKRLAGELEAPLVDLMPLTEALYIEYGPERSKELFVWLAPGEHPNYPQGAADNTHFNETGARLVAWLFASELKHTGHPLGKEAVLPPGGE